MVVREVAVVGVELGWAATLHRLWSSVTVITARDQLADLVLPPLLTEPGVLAVWGLRHDPAGGISAYRWAGLPLRQEDRAEAEKIAARELPVAPIGPELESLRAQGARQVLSARLDVPGAEAGSMLVVAGADADLPRLQACLAQIVDVTREAIRRLLAGRTEDEQQMRDALLAEASLQMDAVLDTTQTMHRAARMAVPAIAEGCLVYVLEDDKLLLRSAVHVDMRRLDTALANPAYAACLSDLASRAVAGNAERVHSGDTDSAGTRTIHPQLLRARGRVLGVLLFLFDRGDDRIPPPDFLRDLAYRAALAIDNGELYEQRRRDVVTMQQHLLPSRLPVVPGIAIAASYAVGDRVTEVGGDFYDVVTRTDGVVAALVGDVCGRGPEAAALTGMARHTLGTLLTEGVSPARALGRLNTGLRRDGSWRFVTAGVAMLRPAAKGLAVQWNSAGHPAPIVLRRGRSAQAARGGGIPLGVLPQATIGRSRLLLAPGDALLMFTDGLTEARDADGVMFDHAALWQALDRLRDAPVETLVHELSQASAIFGGAVADDIAVLAVRAEEHHDG
ncbi:PP2C family protein-serine/threonine phosphatase [Winogradskya consettensis]|uniref:PP2C family protein-serine/threonine phosphatase n=1 Tax=Winogradskya consettensis TaxID=113560 RepID=UPI001BB3B125|nr:PP2C family protein-serine/threonine phosphatase [Actinoplanes consettensis]